jgi:hypothetical protein
MRQQTSLLALMTARGPDPPGARPRAIQPSQLREQTVPYPDPGQHLRLWKATSLFRA